MARGDFPSAKQDQFVLRFHEGLRDRIKATAEANGRSMNAEIVSLLEKGLGFDEAKMALTAQTQVNDALRENFNVLASQLAGPVGENREEVIRVLSALRILGKVVPK